MTTPNRKMYRTYEPISLSPAAPGWRAIYLDDDDERGWFSVPLIAWGILHVVAKPVVGSTAKQEDEGNEINGVVYHDYAESAEDAVNFWKYLGQTHRTRLPKKLPGDAVMPGDRVGDRQPSR